MGWVEHGRGIIAAARLGHESRKGSDNTGGGGPVKMGGVE